MSPIVVAIICLLALIIGAVVSGYIFFNKGIAFRKNQEAETIGTAEQRADQIINDAKNEIENQKKTALVEAKDEKTSA